MSGKTKHDPMFMIAFERGKKSWKITQRVSRFEFADAEDESDELRLVLSGEDIMTLIDHPALIDDGKTFIRFKWGYIGAVSQEKLMVIESLKPRFPENGAVELEVQAYDRSKEMGGHVAQKIWTRKEGYSEDEIAAEIAEKYGLKVDVEPSKNRKLRWTQGAISDIAFLEKLALTAVPKSEKVKGKYKAYVENNTLYFKPSNLHLPPMYEFWYYFTKSPELLSFEPQTKTRNTEKSGSEVSAKGIDTRSNKASSMKANNTNVARNTLGDKSLSKQPYGYDEENKSGRIIPLTSNDADYYK